MTPRDETHVEWDDARWFRPARWADCGEARPRRAYRCRDGMCGAEDCARCHPGTWDREDEGGEE